MEKPSKDNLLGAEGSGIYCDFGYVLRACFRIAL